MATQQLGVSTWAKPAGMDLTGKLFTFMKVDGSGNIVQALAGDPAIGILMEEATSGNAASVQVATSANANPSPNRARACRLIRSRRLTSNFVTFICNSPIQRPDFVW